MITDKRLEQLADVKTICCCRDEEYQEMAAELLRLRQQRRESAPDGVGWIGWGGGDCPVHENAGVIVIFRNREMASHAERAGNYDWKHQGEACDIVAYRPHN